MSVMNFMNNCHVVTLKNLSLKDPFSITAETSEGTMKTYVFNDECRKLIYSKLGLSFSASKQLFKIDTMLWSELIELKMNQLEDNKDFFEQAQFIEYSGMLISDCSDEDNFNEMRDSFISDLESFNIESFDSDVTGNMKVICKSESDTESDYDTILFISFNISGWFSIHTGVISNNKIYLFKKASLEKSSLYEFISLLDIKSLYTITESLPIPDLDFSVKLSVREVIDVIKGIYSDVDMDDENGLIASLSGLNPNDSAKISNALNAFGIPYKSLKKLKFIRKSLKVTSLTVDDLMVIFNSNIRESNLDINPYIISDICNKAAIRDTDVCDIKSEGY